MIDAPPPNAPEPPGRPGRADHPERRRNPELRELLDEMIELVRRLSRDAPGLSPDELAYAQQRIEWLADEIWEAISRKARPPG